MKKILVTGSSGFIGESLVAALQQKNYQILTFDSKDGNISDVDLSQKYANEEIFHVFHLAAKTFVPHSWENPLEFYQTSILGTQQVLELCRKNTIPMTFVSAYVYGIPQETPISEKVPPTPNNPYAHSKYLAEELCKFYAEYYNVKITIARPFNIYGKNQKSHFLIPHILNQVLKDDQITVKDLHPKRDYIYLDDLIDGLIKTMKSDQTFSIYNFGSGKEISVEEIINIIQKIAGSNKEIISEQIERKNEIMNVVADITKAKADLNWEAEHSFEDGIREILRTGLND